MTNEGSSTVRVFSSFEEFWPFYLSEHMNRTNRRWHFAGTTLSFLLLAVALLTPSLLALALAPVPGYLFAWVGHFGFEKNVPASFRYPLLSFRGDLYTYWRTLLGKLDDDYSRHWVKVVAHRRRSERRAA